MGIGNPTPTERRIALMPLDAIAAEIDALTALLRDCLPELDGEGVTIHRVWAALAKDKP